MFYFGVGISAGVNFSVSYFGEGGRREGGGAVGDGYGCMVVVVKVVVGLDGAGGKKNVVLVVTVGFV